MAGELIKNRVRQTCTGTGTNDLNILSGTADVGHLKVAAAFTGLQVGIFALESGADYEIFYGTVSSDLQTLQRTTVIESTNSNARLILDPAQTHKVSSVLPEQLAPYLDAAGRFAKQAIRNGVMEAIQVADTASLPSSPLTDQVVIKLGGASANDGSGGIFWWNGSAWTKLVISNQVDAQFITYDNGTSGLAATDAQAAIDEVEGRLETAETKLATIQNGATANATDAALRDRATHTGTQDWATIAGTPTTLAGYGITDAYTQATIDAAILAAKPIHGILLTVSDETTALTTGTAKYTIRMPYAFTLTGIRASLSTAQASGSALTVDVNEGGASILSTVITFDNTEKTTTTAATPPVISDSSLADDAEITVDIDQVGDGTAKGLKIWLIGRRT